MIDWIQRIANRWPLEFFIIYTFIIHGLGSAIITGGLEFAIAYVMYKAPLTEGDQVKMWGFPYTLAGDLVISNFVQIIVTWFIEEVIINWDWFQQRTCHIPFGHDLYSYGKRGGFNKWWIWWFEIEECTILPRGQINTGDGINLNKGLGLFPQFLKILIFRDKETNGYNWKSGFKWVINKTLRSVLIGINSFLIIWPATLGIMTTQRMEHIDNDFIFNEFPFPQVLKLIFGIVVSFITTPLCVITIILRNDNYLRLVETGVIKDSLSQIKGNGKGNDSGSESSNDKDSRVEV